VKTIVIGGGAAGMMAAYASAVNGHETVLLERNEKLGKKIYITGKGRCNLSNYCGRDDFLSAVVSNPRFLYSSISRLDPSDTVALFNSLGLKTKVERGNRVFPESDRASDVTAVLEKALLGLNVKIKKLCRVTAIKSRDNVFCGVETEGGELIEGDACVIATGGKSYPSTGSTGDGYDFALQLGHTVVKPVPSLVGLKTRESFVGRLEGLSLRNIGLKVYENNKQKFGGQGEMLFTHNGVSGPLILTVSALFARSLAEGNGLKLVIDLKPALERDVLDARLLRDFKNNSNKSLKNVLGGLVPSSMIPVVIDILEMDGEKKVNSVTAVERKKLLELLKNFELHADSAGTFAEAVVTSGGIKVGEVKPGTLESKLVKGVYFAGEVLDLDAFTGGYNLQIAWSTGFLAGQTG